MRRAAVTLALALALALGAGRAHADAPARPAKATFALIVGANQSVDANLAPLKYADDDAARYLDLFRLLGARTYLLSRLDDNTRRLHPQAAAEAEEPKRAPFDRAVAQLAADVAQANQRGVETVVYFVYAGHGNVKDGQGYITLEDARITGGELSQVVQKIPAARVHLVVDACASYFLAYSRGPGGERRALEGFRASALTQDPRVGVLLSTSSARESHEWDAFQSGVFSHEVRSGLYGAADADGDGEVSYREIAAFVARANAAVPNERYRPDVFARPPASGGALLDLRQGLRRRLVVDGARAGHWFLEDARGVRLADLHNAPGQTLSLVRPGPPIPLFLRRVDDERELLVDAAPEVLALADLPEGEPRVRSRGAAHESFSQLFSLPFDQGVVATWREPPPPPPIAEDRPEGSFPKRTVGVVAIGVGAAGLATGGILTWAGQRASSDVPANESQVDVAARNARIDRLNVGAAVAFGAGAVVAGAGVALLLWPQAPRGVQISFGPGGGRIGYEKSF